MDLMYFYVVSTRSRIYRDLKIEVLRHFPRTANVRKSRDQGPAVRFAVWGSRLFGKTTLHAEVSDLPQGFFAP